MTDLSPKTFTILYYKKTKTKQQHIF